MLSPLRHSGSSAGRGCGSDSAGSGAISPGRPGGRVLQGWQVFEPFLEADKVINLPIAKHHALTGATLSFKNWFGILGGQRNRLHQQIHPSLVDLAAFMMPTLTLLDCYRVLLRNGPTGGNLEDVAIKKTLVAGTDPVAMDAYVAKAYWNLESDALPYLKLAEHVGWAGWTLPRYAPNSARYRRRTVPADAGLPGIESPEGVRNP